MFYQREGKLGAFDALLMVGIKMVENMFLNKSGSKEEDSRTRTQKIKDEASKAFKETASFTEDLMKKAESIQRREMGTKSITELKEIAKSSSNTATKMAANLELKQRS